MSDPETPAAAVLALADDLSILIETVRSGIYVDAEEEAAELLAGLRSLPVEIRASLVGFEARYWRRGNVALAREWPEAYEGAVPPEERPSSLAVVWVPSLGSRPVFAPGTPGEVSSEGAEGGVL